MPGLTPNQLYPYPLYTEPANPAGQIQALAEAIDDSFVAVQAIVTTALSRPGAFVTGSVVQSIPNAGATVMTFDVEVFDTANLFNLGVSNTNAVVPVGGNGYYLMVGRVRFATNATGDRNVRFTKNGAAVTSGYNSRAVTAGVETEHLHWEFVSVVAGDILRLEAAQSSAGNLNVDLKQFGLIRMSGP